MKGFIYILTTIFCWIISIAAQAQESQSVSGSVVDKSAPHSAQMLEKQRKLFPQEKVYVMTDRDLYLAGDTARMRAWIYDCNSKKPLSQSKYVYVELRDAADNLKMRRKLLNDSGVMSGYLALPADLISGDYTIIAYTYYMLGTTEALFFRKRLHVMNPKDVSRGLLPTNLTVAHPEKDVDTNLHTAVPVGSNVAISITADRLCRADSTSSIVWSLAHQPDLFTAADMSNTDVLYSPTTPYELGQIISGTVFGNVRSKKVQPNIKVNLIIPSKNYTDVCITDANGRFQFAGFDLPDSTLVFISAKKGKRTFMDNITIDRDTFPAVLTALPASPHYFRRVNDVPTDMRLVSTTVDLANTHLLAEVVVKGEKRERVTETWQLLASRTLYVNDLNHRGIYDLATALQHMPGIIMRNGVPCYRGKPVRFIVDGLEEMSDFDDPLMPGVGSLVALSYPMEIIERIDFVRPEDAAFLPGAAGHGPRAAICVTLKEGWQSDNSFRYSSLKMVWPFGYMKDTPFCIPSADMAWPVVYWNPAVSVSSSDDISRHISSVMDERRQAGDRGSYTVHIDGFTAEGKPIHVEKILKAQ